VEAAAATLKRDRAALEASQTRLLAGWGKELTARTDLGTLVHSLVAQEAALIRVDLLAGEILPPEPRRVRVAPLPGDEAPRDAVVIGPAPTADVQAQGAALLVLLRAPAPAPGAALLAWVSGSGTAQRGLRLPRSAIVSHEGRTFVFVAAGEGAFERRRVELAPPQGDGVVITGGVKADDRIVVTGAQQLLSEDLKAAGGPE
jgi:multidrug efflux pump subunit AcrA (membrane-fusion protein)